MALLLHIGKAILEHRMRSLLRVSVLLSVLLALGSSTSLKAETDHEADGNAYLWCLSYFHIWEDEKGAVSRPTEKLAPFKLADMIVPSDLIRKTQMTGNLPGYIRKYRGVWIWPSVHEPPPFAVIVERLTPTAMTIAFLSRATEENKSYRQRLLRNSRIDLTWNGTAFSTKPEGKIQSVISIYISAFGQAMLFATENNIEGQPPMCLISSKHY